MYSLTHQSNMTVLFQTNKLIPQKGYVWLHLVIPTDANTILTCYGAGFTESGFIH